MYIIYIYVCNILLSYYYYRCYYYLCNLIFSHINVGCSCDPAVYTDDCEQHFCIPFLGVFLFLECVVLTCYVITILYVEIHSKKKSRLWRIILPSCSVGCLGMRVRVGGGERGERGERVRGG